VELLTATRADDVSVLLDQINVRSVVYCLSDLGAPWGFQVDSSATAKFHLVLDGRATLTLSDPGATKVMLDAGELVLLPHGSGHLMRDSGDSAVRPLADILAGRSSDVALSYGGDGPRTRLLCGGFGLAAGLPDDLLSLLPPVLILDTASQATARWLEPAFALLRDEAAMAAPGATAVLAKIADVFLTQVVRTYLSGPDVTTALVSDPAVDAALTLLRSQPGTPWTIVALARKAGMSRTMFAARFRELVGEPPMRYLARLRLELAARYLSATDKTLREIAHLVGYDNESSLSKAFRQAFGHAPGEYRRGQQAANGVRATSDA
jgi:AraC-like DNA-binding protein